MQHWRTLAAIMKDTPSITNDIIIYSSAEIRQCEYMFNKVMIDINQANLCSCQIFIL